MILASKPFLLLLCHHAQLECCLIVLLCIFQIRRLIGDFGVPIAIFFMIAVDINIDDAYTQVSIVKIYPNLHLLMCLCADSRNIVYLW